MDSFEWNKIAGWVLAALIAVLGLVIVSGYIYDTSPPAKPGYVVEGVELEAEAAAPAEVEKPIAFFLASASAEKGANVFKKCAACHTITKGGANGIGPNLWGIMGKNHASVAGFSYSDAMAATKAQPWGWDEMDKWIKAPKAYIPGNKMSFAGIGKAEDRAALFLYLNSQTDSPLPLPPVPAEAAPAEAVAVEGEAPVEAAPEAETAQ